MNTIQSPNSSGQGFCAEHVNHRCHPIVIQFGYVYSHSTPVTKANGEKYLLHSYKLGEHCVCLGEHGWATSCSTASGRETAGYTPFTLHQHLKNKRRRYPELRS